MTQCVEPAAAGPRPESFVGKGPQERNYETRERREIVFIVFIVFKYESCPITQIIGACFEVYRIEHERVVGLSFRAFRVFRVFRSFKLAS